MNFRARFRKKGDHTIARLYDIYKSGEWITGVINHYNSTDVVVWVGGYMTVDRWNRHVTNLITKYPNIMAMPIIRFSNQDRIWTRQELFQCKLSYKHRLPIGSNKEFLRLAKEFEGSKEYQRLIGTRNFFGL